MSIISLPEVSSFSHGLNFNFSFGKDLKEMYSTDLMLQFEYAAFIGKIRKEKKQKLIKTTSRHSSMSKTDTSRKQSSKKFTAAK